MPDPAFNLVSALPKFAPEVRLHPDDPNRPSSVEWYLKRTRLCRWRALLRRDEELLPVGRVTPKKLGGYGGGDRGGTDLYLDIPRGPNQQTTRRGFQPNGGRLSAPCYVNARSAPDDAAAFDFQYWFFYPFNGPEGRHITHQGDWEHVTVRVTNAGEPRLIAAYFSAHGQNNGGWAFPDIGARIGPILQFTPDGNPIVYSALGSHASYASTGVHKQAWPKAGDRTSDGGPIWNTAADLVLVEINGQPLTEREDTIAWLRFPGRWGAIRKQAWPFAVTGPIGPSHQSSWNAEPPPPIS
jgi:hypothetical protein